MDKALGRTVRFYRLTLGHSLRSMAKFCPFSHTLLGTIEQGYPLLVEDHLEALKSFLKVSLTFEPEPYHRFLKLEESALNAFVFHQDETLEHQLEILKNAREEFLQSAYTFDYYFLLKSLGMLLHKTSYAHFTDQEIDVLDQIKPLMRPAQRHLFSLIKSRWHVNQKNIPKAIYELETNLPKDQERVLEGLFYRQLTQLYSLTFYLNKAEENNHKARLVFENTHNYRRLQESQLRFKLGRLLKHKDPQAYEFIELLEACAQQGFHNLHVECLRIQTQLTISQILDDFEEEEAQSKSWAAVKEEVLGFYQSYHTETSSSVQGPFAPFHFYEEGLNALIFSDDEVHLKTYYNVTLDAQLAFENSLAYTLYVRYLSKHRRYKECLRISEQRLKLIQEGT